MEFDDTPKAIQYQRGSLLILDQLKLPDESSYIPINTVDDAWKAIHTMSLRGNYLFFFGYRCKDGFQVLKRLLLVEY